MQCKECLGYEWEIVVKYIKITDMEKGKIYHLYQCKTCKRVVVATYNQFYGSNKI